MSKAILTVYDQALLLALFIIIDKHFCYVTLTCELLICHPVTKPTKFKGVPCTP